MRNRRAKWPRLGPLNINVNPLVIARSFGKLVHLLLSNFQPGRDCDLLADAIGQILECFEGFHVIHFSGCFAGCLSSPGQILPKEVNLTFNCLDNHCLGN